MLRSGVRLICGIGLLSASAFALSACFALPQVPRDVPMSMTLDATDPMLYWCGEDVVVLDLKIYVGVKVRDDSRLVLEDTSALTMESGSSLDLNERVRASANANLHSINLDGENDLIGVILTYRSVSGRPDGTVMAEFHIPRSSPLRKGDAMTWLWANSDLSSAPCGMPSAK